MFKTIGLIASFEDMAMMSNAIKQSGGHFCISEDLYPFTKGKIGADDQRNFFIKLADELE